MGSDTYRYNSLPKECTAAFAGSTIAVNRHAGVSEVLLFSLFTQALGVSLPDSMCSV